MGLAVHPIVEGGLFFSEYFLGLRHHFDHVGVLLFFPSPQRVMTRVRVGWVFSISLWSGKRLRDEVFSLMTCQSSSQKESF